MPSPYNGMINNFHVSRLGRKLAVDDQKVLIALPKDVIPERTWCLKEDNKYFYVTPGHKVAITARYAYGKSHFLDRGRSKILYLPRAVIKKALDRIFIALAFGAGVKYLRSANVSHSLYYRPGAEILQKEDTELVVLEMREEIVEAALQIGFERYMQRQTAPFAAHCAAQAWLKLIDWNFYRHDPGEDPTAYPPCFIPRRADSWVPDEMPEPSPKDSWARQSLTIVEEFVEGLKKATSSDSIDVPVVDEIPRECWFPGKVQLPGYMADSDYDYESITYDETVSSDLAADSELLQKVTDYTPEEDTSITESVNAQSVVGSVKALHESGSPTSLGGAGDAHAQRSKSTKIQSSKSKMLNRSSWAECTTSLHGTGDAHAPQSGFQVHHTLSSKSKLQTRLSWAESSTSFLGAGDSHAPHAKSTKSLSSKCKSLTRSRMGRSSVLPPLGSDSRSQGSINSDRRLRGLRLETQYEIASEKVDTPPKVNAKRK